MTVTAATPAVPAPTAPARAVAVLIKGLPVLVPEPGWCVSDHGGDHISLDDVSHYSASISATAPLYGGGTVETLSAAIYQWPFGSEGREPYLGLDPDGDGNVTPLAPGAALAFADQLVAHAGRLRAMAGRLAPARAEVI